MVTIDKSTFTLNLDEPGHFRVFKDGHRPRVLYQRLGTHQEETVHAPIALHSNSRRIREIMQRSLIGQFIACGLPLCSGRSPNQVGILDTFVLMKSKLFT